MTTDDTDSADLLGYSRGAFLVFSFKRQDGVLAKVQMKLLNDHEALLKPLNDPSVEEAMTVKMVRDK